MNNRINFTCPKCQKERDISLHQYYNIEMGVSTGKCNSCGTVPNKGRFKKGLIPWNYNKKMPLEFGKKLSANKQRNINISIARKGKPLSLKHRLALSFAKKGKPINHFINNKEEIGKKIGLALRGRPHFNMRGENHPNWKGGLTSINQKIRSSLEYILWRRAVFERDNWTCVWCGERGGKLHADHIKSFSLFPELRFAIDNGRTLCYECHRKTSTWGGRIYHGFKKD